jgi:hypothetical protein
MKKIKIIAASIMSATILFAACTKLDRLPETQLTDDVFWNTETDLINATNRLYQQLDAFWIDNRADDVTNTAVDQVSSGNRVIPNTSGDWNDRYDEIFTANNILEKAGRAQVTEAVRNRYRGEAMFFRAYAYTNLMMKYGDVALVLKTLTVNSPELLMGRSPRQDVITAIYKDLDSAASYLPKRSALAAPQYGRVTRSTALALKARIGLYEGTRAKFHADPASNSQTHLNIAIAAATAVMGEGHTLYPNYRDLFTITGEGIGNTENIFVKIFGASNANAFLAHNNSRDLENGRMAPTRNLVRQYLYSDGLPAWNTDGTTPSAKRSALFVAEANETSYNTILTNRDPRADSSFFKAGDQAYQGPWVPKTSLGSRTAFAPKKGFSVIDQQINNAGTTDRILIRYAEVLLILAEAKYELNGTITDADLNSTINLLRARVGFTPKLTNAFVTANGLDMREEIRRERTVELALEGFRYDDLVRWKTAETVLPKELLGAKFIATEWVGTNQTSLNLNADKILITETATNRHFLANRDYLYPVPLNEIALSGGNVKQNPNWQ